jgi:hypothetical protein
MRFPYPIWSETGRKEVVDGGVDLGLLKRAAARGHVDSGQGKLEALPERVGRLAGKERKLLGAGIWAGWSGRGEFRRTLGGRLSGREQEEREKQQEGRARIGFYRGANARPCSGRRAAPSCPSGMRGGHSAQAARRGRVRGS